MHDSWLWVAGIARVGSSKHSPSRRITFPSILPLFTPPSQPRPSSLEPVKEGEQLYSSRPSKPALPSKRGTCLIFLQSFSCGFLQQTELSCRSPGVAYEQWRICNIQTINHGYGCLVSHSAACTISFCHCQGENFERLSIALALTITMAMHGFAIPLVSLTEHLSPLRKGSLWVQAS